jgi:hypothetical protein
MEATATEAEAPEEQTEALLVEVEGVEEEGAEDHFLTGMQDHFLGIMEVIGLQLALPAAQALRDCL